MEQCYNIAGLITKFDSSGRTYHQAIPYRCHNSGSPDIVIPTERIQKNCKLWKETNFPNSSYDELEYMVTGALFYLYLLDFDGLMLHASAVVMDGKAYLFTADSGTGKSTHVNLWLQQFGERAFVLNDDKPALRREKGKWYAYGTPWSGKNDISRNYKAELAGIAILERDIENSITRVNDIDTVFALLAQVNKTKEPSHRIKIMELMDSIFESVPIWKLKCNMNPDAAIMAYNTMSKTE